MELSKKERRELRRQEKQQELTARSQKKSIKKWVVWFLVVVFVLALGWWLYKSLPQAAKIPEIGESYPDEGRNHVTEGTKIEYNTNPPSSGSHYGEQAAWGIYDHEIPDEAVVHNLEHGGVWISYKPSISEATKKKLAEIAKSNTKVILTPRAKNDFPIALASWMRVHKIEISPDGSFDEGTVQNFILKYKNTGPEQVPDNMQGKNY